MRYLPSMEASLIARRLEWSISGICNRARAVTTPPATRIECVKLLTQKELLLGRPA